MEFEKRKNAKLENTTVYFFKKIRNYTMCGERERWKVSDEYGVETTEEFYDGDDENRRCCEIS